MACLVYPVAYERPQIEGYSFAGWALSIVQGKDPAWNCFPSTHCTASTVAALALYFENRKMGIWGLLSTVAICFSTVFTKQHFVLDVVVGVLLGSGIYFLVRCTMMSTRFGGLLAARLGFADRVSFSDEVGL